MATRGGVVMRSSAVKDCHQLKKVLEEAMKTYVSVAEDLQVRHRRHKSSSFVVASLDPVFYPFTNHRNSCKRSRNHVLKYNAYY